MEGPAVNAAAAHPRTVGREIMAMSRFELRAALIGAAIGAWVGSSIMMALTFIPLFTGIELPFSPQIILFLDAAPSGYIAMLCFVTFVFTVLGFGVGLALVVRHKDS